MSAVTIPKLDPEFVRSFCRRRQIAELRVFGSILRDDFRPDSDVDFIATLEPGVRWTLADHLDAEDELRQRLGRAVDLALVGQLKWVIRDRVLDSSEVVYAE
ncbi:MAG: hypothetical protein GX446_13765 [Chthonomonadales bacterium]|nr:hypothetical protein [Chthonomonadales bacterium]